jgi:prolyl-tRNA editing enzyme YbaK/EbsC (Cys-tRNA(Pro) deacylase)
VLVDEEILEEEFVAISAGVPEAGLLLRSEDLLRVVPGTLGRFSQ